MEMTRTILEQYCEKKVEVRDLRNRIDRDKRKLEEMEKKGYPTKISKLGGKKTDGCEQGESRYSEVDAQSGL